MARGGGGGYNQRKQSRKIEGEKMSNLITKYDYPMEVKLRNFEKYVTRQSLSRFIARYELFKMIKDTQGSIIECGRRNYGIRQTMCRI